jgi:hypothetical protein
MGERCPLFYDFLTFRRGVQQKPPLLPQSELQHTLRRVAEARAARGE